MGGNKISGLVSFLESLFTYKKHFKNIIIDLWLLYDIGFISVIHQNELTIGIHMSPPSWISLPPPAHSHSSRLLQSPTLSSLSYTANSHWLSILPMLVYMYPCYCLHSSHPLLFSLSISLLSMSVSPLWLCEQIRQYHPSRSQIYALIYDIWKRFS